VPPSVPSSGSSQLTIYKHLGSEDKRLLWFENSGHEVVVDSEKEAVWAQAYEFITRHL